VVGPGLGEPVQQQEGRLPGGLRRAAVPDRDPPDQRPRALPPVTRERRNGLLWAVGTLVGLLVAGWVLPDGAPLGIIAQGVVLGTVTALLAMGLILVYRTSNIVNFAYGSMGGVGGVL